MVDQFSISNPDWQKVRFLESEGAPPDDVLEKLLDIQLAMEKLRRAMIGDCGGHRTLSLQQLATGQQREDDQIKALLFAFKENLKEELGH